MTDGSPWSWSTTTELMPHQLPAVTKLARLTVGALYMEMGLGKTRCAIELISRRWRARKVDRVVYLCPVALRGTVATEWQRHTTLPAEAICIHEPRLSTARVQAAAVVIVGIESISSSARTVFRLQQIINARTFVVLDESNLIKGHRALRAERLVLLCRPARYRLILTGTPFTQGVQDLYMQMRWLDDAILGYRSYYTFSDQHLVLSDKIRGKIVRATNTDLLARKIAPYAYQVTKAEALALPPKRYALRTFPMSEAQASAYRRAKDYYFGLIEDQLDHDPSCLIYALFTALQQIVCGFWLACPDGPETYPHGRIELLMRTLEEIQGRCLIWADYHRCIDQISAALIALHGPSAIVVWDGRRTTTEREIELARWRQTDVRFFVATPATGGHGLTLNEAQTAVFYTNGWKVSHRLQAEDRIHRIGQTRPVCYIDLEAEGTIDQRKRDSLSRKSNVLSAFRTTVDEIKTHSKSEIRRQLRQLREAL